MIRWGAATRDCCYFPAKERQIVERTGCVVYRKGERNEGFVINTMILGIEGTQSGREGERGEGKVGSGGKRTLAMSPSLPLTNGPGRNPPSNDAKASQGKKKRAQVRNVPRTST